MKSSKYRGVTKRKDRYIARIYFANDTEYIGSYNTELEAAIEYDKKAVYIKQEEATTNFPIDNYNEKFCIETQALLKKYNATTRQEAHEKQLIEIRNLANLQELTIKNNINLYLLNEYLH
jgi:hypothetical protein